MASDDDPRPVGALDPDERAALVRKRRVWRRIKAAGALVLGVGAGTFLACYSAVTRAPVRTLSPDPEPYAASRDSRGLDAGTGAAPPRSSDAGTGVDVDEHRRGMPVPDNLLE